MDLETQILMAFVERQKLSVFVSLLERVEDLDAIRDGSSLLMTAVNYEREDVVRYLLKRGACPNRMVNNSLPIFEATQWGNANMVQLLLAHGANPDVTLQYSNNPEDRIGLSASVKGNAPDGEDAEPGDPYQHLATVVDSLISEYSRLGKVRR